jgi:hypothetical protein
MDSLQIYNKWNALLKMPSLDGLVWEWENVSKLNKFPYILKTSENVWVVNLESRERRGKLHPYRSKSLSKNNNLWLPVAVEGVVQPRHERPDSQKRDAAVVKPEKKCSWDVSKQLYVPQIKLRRWGLRRPTCTHY